MPKYRHGAAAIEQAAARKGGGGSSSFAPEIFWKEDAEKKFILVLTPTEEVGIFDLHEFIPLKGENSKGEEYEYFASFLSRKDPYIGEDYDKIEDDLERKPKTRVMGVAVELEPVMETVKGRKRPVSFAVKTREFERTTDDGEETVTVPLIGLITQSSQLMWSPLKNIDEGSHGPLEDLPLEVTRRIPGGQKSNTTYEFVPFSDIPVDLSGIVEYLDGLTYFGDEDLSELITELEAIDGDDLKSAQAVARALLDKRVEELADGDRYEKLLADVDYLEPPAWEKGKSKGKSASKEKAKPKRPARPTRRKAVKDEEPEPNEPETEEETSEPEPSKDDKFAKLKAKLDSK